MIADRGLDDGVIYEMVLRHELQHTETMRQTLALAGLLSDDDRAAATRPLAGAERGAGDRPGSTSPPGTFEMGARAASFAYDNERPAHTLGARRLSDRAPPGAPPDWMRFAQEGGYERARAVVRRGLGLAPAEQDRAGSGDRRTREPRRRCAT